MSFKAAHGLSPSTFTISPESSRATPKLITGSSPSSAQRGSLVTVLMAIANSGLRGVEDTEGRSGFFQSPPHNQKSALSCVPLTSHARHHQTDFFLGRLGPREFADDLAA